MRPVPLKTHVIGVPLDGRNGAAFEYSLNYKLPEILNRHASGKPALIVKALDD